MWVFHKIFYTVNLVCLSVFWDSFMDPRPALNSFSYLCHLSSSFVSTDTVSECPLEFSLWIADFPRQVPGWHIVVWMCQLLTGFREAVESFLSFLLHIVGTWPGCFPYGKFLDQYRVAVQTWQDLSGKEWGLLLLLSLIFFKFTIILMMFVCGHGCHGVHMTARGQLCGVSFLLLSFCGFQGPNSGHWAYVLVANGPSHWSWWNIILVGFLASEVPILIDYSYFFLI